MSIRNLAPSCPFLHPTTCLETRLHSGLNLVPSDSLKARFRIRAWMLPCAPAGRSGRFWRCSGTRSSIPMIRAWATRCRALNWMIEIAISWSCLSCAAARWGYINDIAEFVFFSKLFFCWVIVTRMVFRCKDGQVLGTVLRCYCYVLLHTLFLMEVPVSPLSCFFLKTLPFIDASRNAVSFPPYTTLLSISHFFRA